MKTITANELRIGNLVRCQVSNGYVDGCQIFNLLGGYCRCYVPNDLEEGQFDYSSISGIQLTEEWLLKYGFTNEIHQLQNLFFALTGKELDLSAN
jgi:hypothetical protein